MVEAQINDRTAVVIGDRIAGLLAAKVLSRHIRRVKIFERDRPPASVSGRKSTPQAWQVHTLLKSGERVLEELFPGLCEELTRAGAMPVDCGSDIHFHHFGIQKNRSPSGLVANIQTRFLLEDLIRKRVTTEANVDIIWGKKVGQLVMSSDGSKVSGVRLTSEKGGPEVQMADFVVDASGRGSRLANWLSGAGCASVPVDRVGLELKHAGCFFERQPQPSNEADWLVALVYPRAPLEHRYGVAFPVQLPPHLPHAVDLEVLIPDPPDLGTQCRVISFWSRSEAQRPHTCSWPKHCD